MGKEKTSSQGSHSDVQNESATRVKRPYRKKSSISDPTKGMGIDNKKLREVCSLHTKLVRNIVGLSRQQLAEKINMSPQIVRVWEDMHAGTVSDKGARKLKEQLDEMGVAVDEQWLMYGTGCMPIITYKYYQSQGLDITLNEYRKLLSEDAVINQELHMFDLNVKDAIVLTIEDEACEPAYFPGDKVGGIIVTDPKKIKELEHRYCIFKTLDGDLICRKLNAVHDDLWFDLSGTNKQSVNDQRVKVEFVAQITRYWGRLV